MPVIEIYHASAGCGKTTKLLELVNEELERGVPLCNIAFVSFTRIAAFTALNRVFDMCSKPIKKKDARLFRTIHSMCFKQLNANRYAMMNHARYKKLGELGNFELGDFQTLDFTETRISAGSFTDNQLILFDHIYRNNPSYADKLLAEVPEVSYARIVTYQKLARKFRKVNGYMDFTDLLERCNGPGRKVHNVKVAFIDEAQDLTPLQWQVCFQLFGGADTLYIAGDANQCLYSFTGADPKALVHMRGNLHYLRRSYRVPSEILSIASHILDQIPEQSKVDYEWEPAYIGGSVRHIINLYELPPLPKTKTMLLIARNRVFLKKYVEWCVENGYPYFQGDRKSPVFTKADLIAYKEGRVEDWAPDRLEFARRCENSGHLFEEPRILISTIHGVKGDEADIVCLMTDMGMEAYRAFSTEAGEEEEHRCFFVGVTRSKETLYILEPQTNRYYSPLLQ